MTTPAGLITKPAPAAQANGEKQPPPFGWNIVRAAEKWTDDPDLITRMSDPPIIEGLLREREVVSIVGAAKSSKTWISLAVALAVASGEEVLGHPTQRRKVLYLDYELKQGTFLKRLCMLSQHPPEDFHFQCLRGVARPPSIKEIIDLIEAESFGLVVIDSLYRTTWLAEENSNDSTPRILAGLQELTDKTRCSVLVVDHTAKGGGADKSVVDAARGASSKGGFYDGVLLLRSSANGPDPEKMYVALDAVLRDWPPLKIKPLIGLSWNAGRVEIELAGEAPCGDANSTQTAVLDTVSQCDDGISVKEIAEELGTSKASVQRALDELVKRRLVEKSKAPGNAQKHLYSIKDAA